MSLFERFKQIMNTMFKELGIKADDDSFIALALDNIFKFVEEEHKTNLITGLPKLDENTDSTNKLINKAKKKLGITKLTDKDEVINLKDLSFEKGRLKTFKLFDDTEVKGTAIIIDGQPNVDLFVYKQKGAGWRIIENKSKEMFALRGFAGGEPGTKGEILEALHNDIIMYLKREGSKKILESIGFDFKDKSATGLPNVVSRRDRDISGLITEGDETTIIKDNKKDRDISGFFSDPKEQSVKNSLENLINQFVDLDSVKTYNEIKNLFDNPINQLDLIGSIDENTTGEFLYPFADHISHVGDKYNLLNKLNKALNIPVKKVTEAYMGEDFYTIYFKTSDNKFYSHYSFDIDGIGKTKEISKKEYDEDISEGRAHTQGNIVPESLMLPVDFEKVIKKLNTNNQFSKEEIDNLVQLYESENIDNKELASNIIKGRLESKFDNLLDPKEQSKYHDLEIEKGLRHPSGRRKTNLQKYHKRTMAKTISLNKNNKNPNFKYTIIKVVETGPGKRVYESIAIVDREIKINANKYIPSSEVNEVDNLIKKFEKTCK